MLIYMRLKGNIVKPYLHFLKKKKKKKMRLWHCEN